MPKRKTPHLSPLEKLRRIGDARESLDDWLNYRELGLDQSFIPDLIEIVQDREFFKSDAETPEIWATIHAWRALAQLRAVEAIEPLCGLLPLADTQDDGDWVMEEIPVVFGMIGPTALPALERSLADSSLGVFARSTASGCIVEIGRRHAAHRPECVETIRARLERYTENSEELNGFLVCDLMKLQAVEAVETIREAYRHKRVESQIPGSLEDVESKLGLGEGTKAPKQEYGKVYDLGRAREEAEAATAGRNDPCPCGSGKKYKKCCLPKHEAARSAQAVAVEKHPPAQAGRKSPFKDLDEAAVYEDDNVDVGAEDEEEEEDSWWERLAALSPVERYETVLRTLEEGFAPEHYDPVDALFHLKHELQSKGYVAETVHLAQKIRACLPRELYEESFEYFDGVLVDWALFNGDAQGVREGLVSFLAHPVHGIDAMIPILDRLCFYGLSEQAVRLSEETFARVHNSPDLLAGAAWELAQCIYLDRLQRLYDRRRRGEDVDWDSIIDEMEPYDFAIDRELAERIRAGLAGSLDGAGLAGAFARQRDDVLAKLVFGFLCHMRDQKKMDFVCSELIWRYLYDYLAERKLPAKKAQPDAFFHLTRQDLEPYLAEMIGGFLTHRQAEAVAVLWGIPYIYDFLLNKQIISANTHQKALQVAAVLKIEIIKSMSDYLWEYDFVHRWAAPDSADESELAREAAIFRRSCQPDVPLAELKNPEK